MTSTEPLAALDARPIPITEITPSPFNTRKIFDPVKLWELAASIQANGIIEPLIVRPRDPKAHGLYPEPFELVAGERRFRAAKLAGLVEVPCIVRELTDEQVLDQQLIENIQREDLHPLEEARGYEQRKDAGATNDDLVRITGKDRTTVARRLQLLQLIEEAQQIFLRGGMIPKQALMISRLPQSEQSKALLYVMTGRWDLAAKAREGELLKLKPDLKASESPSQLAHFIDSVIMRPLAKAPWSKKDANLVPEAGSCNACTKRTGSNALLFDEAGAKNDRCLDGACYEAKLEAHLIQLETKATAKGEVVKRIESSGFYTEWKEVQGDRCESEIKGVMADGNRRGEIRRVCMDKSCKIHWGSRSSSSSRSSGQKDREEKLKQERQYRAQLWTAVAREIKQPGLEDIRAAALSMWERAWHDLKKSYMDARGIEAPKTTSGRDYDKPVAKLIGAMKQSKELLVWMVTFALWRDCYVQNYEKKDTKDELHAAADRYGVKAAEIRREVVAEFTAKREKKQEAAKKKATKGKKKAKGKAVQTSLLEGV